MPNSIYSYQSIAPEECMGDSLAKINNNNFLADSAIGILETRIVAASASLNTRIASTSSTTITTLSTVPYARLNDGNQSGLAPIYGCRAWVNFNGQGATGTEQTIRASGNISKVVKLGTSNYAVVFQIPMQDNNYVLQGSATKAGIALQVYTGDLTNVTAVSCQVFCAYDYGTGSGTAPDSSNQPDIVMLSFIR